MTKLQKSWLVAVTSLAVVLFSIPLKADNPEAPPKPMVVDGVEGIWFRADSARRFLQLDDQVATLQAEGEKKDKLLSINNTLLDLNTQLKETAIQQAKIVTDQLVVETNRRIAAEKTINVWYRSPVLWFMVGALATTAVVVTVK